MCMPYRGHTPPRINMEFVQRDNNSCADVLSVHLSVLVFIQLSEVSYSAIRTHRHVVRALDTPVPMHSVVRKCREIVPSAGAVQVKCHLLFLSHSSHGFRTYKQTHTHTFSCLLARMRQPPALPENTACLSLIARTRVWWMPANTCTCARALFFCVCVSCERSE